MKARLGRLLIVLSVLAVASGCSWITRASIDQGGNDPENGSANPSLTASGQYVAFESGADDLVPNDTNGETDVFVRDVWNGSTVRASVDSDENQYSVKSIEPAISADGRFVAFEKYNYPNDTNRIMVRDLVAGTTVDATLDPAGGPPDDDSRLADISADGRFVVFESSAADLVGSTSDVVAVVVYDAQSRTTTPLVPIDLPVYTEEPSISDDGHYVAFALVALDGVSHPQVYVHDMETGVDELVSADASGAPGNSTSDLPSISADGRYVAFHSDATNLVHSDDGNQDGIYVRDRSTGTTERASVDADGGNPDGRNVFPRLSGDGRYVAFWTLATDLIAGLNTFSTVVIRDLVTNTTMTGSSNLINQPVTTYGSADGFRPSFDLSGDGTYLAFSAVATLTPGDHNGFADMHVRMVVGARVVSVSPTSIARGTTETFTLTGERFVPGTTVDARTQSQGTDHVVVDSVDVVSDTELAVTITVDTSAPPEPLYFTVIVPGPGPGSWLNGTATLAPVSPTIT